MCSLTSIILAKNSFIYSANGVYSNLNDAQELFEKQVNIVNYVKCVLLRNESLIDFNVNGIDVSVFGDNENYELFFDNYVISIQIDNKRIVDYDINKH